MSYTYRTSTVCIRTILYKSMKKRTVLVFKEKRLKCLRISVFQMKMRTVLPPLRSHSSSFITPCCSQKSCRQTNYRKSCNRLTSVWHYRQPLSRRHVYYRRNHGPAALLLSHCQKGKLPRSHRSAYTTAISPVIRLYATNAASHFDHTRENNKVDHNFLWIWRYGHWQNVEQTSQSREFLRTRKLSRKPPFKMEFDFWGRQTTVSST